MVINLLEERIKDGYLFQFVFDNQMFKFEHKYCSTDEILPLINLELLTYMAGKDTPTEEIKNIMDNLIIRDFMYMTTYDHEGRRLKYDTVKFN